MSDSVDNDVYGEKGVPEYNNKEYFSVKFFHGGHFEDSPLKQWVGGTLNYFDFCHPDYISMLDIAEMGKKLGYKGGHFKFQFKTTATSMDKGLWELENDDDIMTMCMLIPASRLIEIYLEVIRPVASSIDLDDERESTDEDYVDSSGEESTDDEEDYDLDEDDDDEEDYDLDEDYDMYLKVYRHNIEPVRHKSEWDPIGVEPPLPPVKHTPVGRPKVVRRKDNDIPESCPKGTSLKMKGTSLRCGFCKEWCHNSRGCPQKHNKEPGAKRAKKVQQTSTAATQEFTHEAPTQEAPTRVYKVARGNTF